MDLSTTSFILLILNIAFTLVAATKLGLSLRRYFRVKSTYYKPIHLQEGGELKVRILSGRDAAEKADQYFTEKNGRHDPSIRIPAIWRGYLLVVEHQGKVVLMNVI